MKSTDTAALSQALPALTDGLTDAQRVAFDALHRFALGRTDHAMAVLRGFAGTGKTYLISRLIHALGGAGINIAVAAPTNKAVRVLREKIVAAGVPMPDEAIDGRFGSGALRTDAPWIEFGSIHSLLGLKLTELEDGTQACQSARNPSLHEYDLAIIDECSMIGADLFARIVAAKRRCLVLFVGDPAQLPPIEAGEAISPTFSKVALEVTLSEVVRQARDNPIINLSMRIRQAIEADRRIDCASIAEVLPPLAANSEACLVSGGAETLVQFALHEIRDGRDARILAYTNQAVIAYNRAIHDALYGTTEFPFVTGEPVITQSACDAFVLDDAGRPTGLKTNLITSEEAIVRAVVPSEHPRWKQVPCVAVTLERDSGARALVYAAIQPEAVEQAVSASFDAWRRLKAEADVASHAGRSSEARQKQDEAKGYSQQAWDLRKSFAPLRHGYALTVHKSQGSTFDTALVDLNDINKMRSTFSFNRGLYVAITRPRLYLGMVV